MSERSHVLRRTITLSFSSAIGYQHLSVNLLLDVMRMYGCWIYIKEGTHPDFMLMIKPLKGGRQKPSFVCLLSQMEIIHATMTTLTASTVTDGAPSEYKWKLTNQ